MSLHRSNTQSGIRRHILRLLFLPVSLSVSVAVAVPPDAGTLMRDQEVQWGDPLQWRISPPLDVSEEASSASSAVDVTMPVSAYRLEGVSLVSESDIQAVLAPFRGREVGVADIYRAADEVMAFYREAGYLARAWIPEQVIDDGEILIRVVEAQLESIQLDVDDTHGRLPSRYAKAVLESSRSAGEAVYLPALEHSAAILQRTPGVAPSVVLQPGERQGQTRVVAKLVSEPLVSGMLTVDNFGSRATNEERGGLDISLASPRGVGDALRFSGNSSGESHYGRLEYSVPVAHQGLRLAGHAAYLDYGLGSDFAPLDAEGDALIAGLSADYPVFFSSRGSLRYTALLEQRTYQDRRAGTSISERDVTALTLALEGDRTDRWWMGGLVLYRVALTAGNLSLGDADERLADRLTSDRAGGYVKLDWRLSRVQMAPYGNSFWLSFSGQHANGNLDSSEQTGLGGPAGVRAYASSEGSGDESLMFTAEWRFRLNQRVQGRLFYDVGQVTVYRDTWVGWNAGNPDLDNRYTLKGAGTGLTLSLPAGLSARADVAWRLGDNPARDPNTGKDTDGTKRNPRVWASISKSF